jgi:hypothetical protein
MSYKIALEVMSATETWQDLTNILQRVEVDGIGMTGRRAYHPWVAHCTLKLWNDSKLYNPADTGIGTGALDVRRRVRFKVTGANHAKCLQVSHDGQGQNAYFTQVVTTAVTNGDVWLLTWDARASFGSYWNQDQVYIATSAETQAAQLFSYTNKWASYSLAFIATSDATTIAPRFRAYQNTDAANSRLIEYRNINLRKVTAATTTITATGTTAPLGDSGGTEYEQAQSFVPSAGKLIKVTVTFGANTGSPSGNATVRIREEDNTRPGTILATTTCTPVASSTVTINLPTGPDVTATTYWLHLAVPAQATNARYNWQGQTPSVYASGNQSQTIDAGTNWTKDATLDLQCAFTVITSTAGSNVLANGDFATGSTSPWTTTNVSSVAVTGAQYATSNQDANVSLAFDGGAGVASLSKLAQSFLSANLVSFNADTVKLYLKKVGSPTGTLTCRIETDSNNAPSGTLIHANATATLAESGLGTSYALETFTMSAFAIPIGIKYWVVLSTNRAASATNYVQWGADGSSPSYADGEMKSYGATWTAENKDACFEITGTRNSTRALTGVVDDYDIKFNGFIEVIGAIPHEKGGQRITQVLAVDGTDPLRTVGAALPLQKTKRADELVTTALAVLPQRSAATSLVGADIDTTLSTFSNSFDGYTEENSTVLGAIDDALRSEYGLCWFDPDGTFRAVGRDFLPKLTVQPVKLTLSDGMRFELAPVTRDVNGVWNKINMIYTPRKTVVATTVLGQIVSPIEIPPIAANGTPGQTEVILTYRDQTTGQFVAGEQFVTPLAATTDYLINEHPSGTSVDYTTSGYVTITVVETNATQAKIRLENRAYGRLYAIRLQIRGYAITSYDPLTLTYIDATSIASYQQRKKSIELPFTDDPRLPDALGRYLLDRYKYPFAESEFFRSDWLTSLNGVEIMSLNPHDLIDITDTQSGYDGLHRLIRMDYAFDVESGVPMAASFTGYLERQDDTTYWLLGDATYGALGTTTRLYI